MKRNIDTYLRRRNQLNSEFVNKQPSVPVWEVRRGVALSQNRAFIDRYFSNEMIEYMNVFELKFLSSLQAWKSAYTKKQKEKAIEIHNNVIARIK